MTAATLSKHANTALLLRKRRGVKAQTGAAQGDDALSLDMFLSSVEQKAYRIAFYSVRDEQLSLDLVQDAMLKLVEKYASKPSEEWPALFFTILSNRIIDARRWNRLREGGGKLVSLFRSKTGSDDDQERDILESDASVYDLQQPSEPESDTFGRELRHVIDDALKELSERQRQVFLLREWQGFNVQQTATILGCSDGSVKQHHFRAMRNLRKQLAMVWSNEQANRNQ
ncbi:MAG: RNA polymerase sigma factor [Gammaproteobacteria bacterium]|nr:RNA polymerase sigma factor [Gammaproteobacteria bacterium]